jgi:hypothetical protein
MASAWLLPDGYESRGFISIVESGQNQATVNRNATKTFAVTKAEAVEQFSMEMADGYNNGFALSPQNAILNFDIRGLASNTEGEVVLTVGTFDVSGTVITDASGTATFAIGVNEGKEPKDLALRVGSTAITLNLDGDNNKTFAAGKVYNINRSMVGHALSASGVGDIVGSDGKAYAVADKDNLPSDVTAVAMVAYKSETTGSSLAIALADDSNSDWNTAKSTCEGKSAVTNAAWLLPSQNQWKAMFSANGDNQGQYTGLNTAITTAGGTALQGAPPYWSSTPSGYDDGTAYNVLLGGGGAEWYRDYYEETRYRVRACLAF